MLLFVSRPFNAADSDRSTSNNDTGNINHKKSSEEKS